MKVNHKTKDDRTNALEYSLRGTGKYHSSISNFDEFELMKDKKRFEFSSDISIATFFAEKEIVKMIIEENLDANPKGEGEDSSLEEMSRAFYP